jgi:hypothetical protein
MKWWGMHPLVGRAEVRRLLPVAPCRRCVYSIQKLWDRLEDPQLMQAWADETYNRCGLTMGPLLARVIEELRTSRVNAPMQSADDPPTSC